MSHGTIESIISDHRQLKKVAARGVPDILTDDLQIKCVRLCKENLAKFHQETWRSCGVVMGDELRL